MAKRYKKLLPATYYNARDSILVAQLCQEFLLFFMGANIDDTPLEMISARGKTYPAACQRRLMMKAGLRPASV